MSKKLDRIHEAHEILKSYSGDNPYIIRVKNGVYAYHNYTMTDFDVEFILRNHNKEPKYINKIVKIADWWGEKKQEEWQTEFLPEKLLIGWYLGDTETTYVFYCKYRRSLEKGVLTFAPKTAILTDFLSDDFHDMPIDFTKYNERAGITLFPHQEEAVKFLLSKRKCILANAMGSGKTSAAIVAALEGQYNHILIICPASVKTSWHRELTRYVDEDDVTIVNGSKWCDAKFTVINYDILKNFYEIPTETIKKGELGLTDDGKLIKEYKDVQVVSRKSDIISKAMDNSQLFKSEFDLIIIDEAHRLSNTTSGFFKIVSDLVKRSCPKGIFELTGTPITNNNKNLYNLLKIIGHPITANWEHYMKRYCGAKSFYNKKEREAVSRYYINKHNKQSWYDLSYAEKAELDDLIDKKCKKIWTFPESTYSDELGEIIKTCYLRREKEEFIPLPKKEVKLLSHKLTKDERASYDLVWEEYVTEKSAEKDIYTIEKHRNITEGIILRQWLADHMIKHTVKLAKKLVDNGEKAVIFCSFDNEIDKLMEEFGDMAVYHNGKLTSKRKDKAVDTFQTDENVKIFIGNIESASVGITLTAATNVIFNSVDWVPGINWQAEDRIHRIGQDKPCTIYYQTFKDTYFEHILEVIADKSENINKIIKKENDKN